MLNTNNRTLSVLFFFFLLLQLVSLSLSLSHTQRHRLTHTQVTLHTLQSGNFLVNSARRQAADKGRAAPPGVPSSGGTFT